MNGARPPLQLRSHIGVGYRMNRRQFIVQGVAGVGAVGAGLGAGRGQSPATRPATPPATGPAEVIGRQHLDPVLVNEFVGAGHGDLAKVKQMLADESPAQKRLGGLIVAERELGLGDLETALGGAAHTGHTDIALYLLDNGARIDAFAAAMLGYRDVVAAMLKVQSKTATTL